MSEPTPEPAREPEPSPTAAADASALAAYESEVPVLCSAAFPSPCPRRAVWFAALVHVAHPPHHDAFRCTDDLLSCDVHRDHFTAATAAGSPSFCGKHRHAVAVTWTRLYPDNTPRSNP